MGVFYFFEVGLFFFEGRVSFFPRSLFFGGGVSLFFRRGGPFFFSWEGSLLFLSGVPSCFLFSGLRVFFQCLVVFWPPLLPGAIFFSLSRSSGASMLTAWWGRPGLRGGSCGPPAPRLLGGIHQGCMVQRSRPSPGVWGVLCAEFVCLSY